ncbi:MAG: hypothetical protein ACYTGN_15500 [Planctomycetota bacterium]|jgi:signal transduction histidine kinase
MSQKRTHKRRQYVVDKELQIATMIQLVSVMVVMGVLYMVALFVLPASKSGDIPTSAEMRDFLVQATAVYFALATAIIGILTILVTHRVAGPALVIMRAVQGMRRGEFDHRLKLRKSDYLKKLAAEVDGLRSDVKARNESVSALVACVQEGDLDGAREVATRLGAKQPAEEPEPATV